MINSNPMRHYPARMVIAKATKEGARIWQVSRVAYKCPECERVRGSAREIEIWCWVRWDYSNL